MKTHLEKLLTEAAECQTISDLAPLPEKRDLFAKLAQHHRTLAAEIERAMQAQSGTHTSQAKQVAEEYANDQREIIKKWGKKPKLNGNGAMKLTDERPLPGR